MEDTPTEYVSLNEFWNFELERRMRTIAVHTVAVSRTPWEMLHFGDVGVHASLLDAVRIDKELLIDCDNSRNVILGAWSKLAKASAIKDMKLVARSCGNVLKNDRFVALERNYIEHVIDLC